MTDKKIGIFAGSFDPLTYGHLDLIKRASRLFDELIVLIAYNTSKQSLFDLEERIELVEQSVGEIANVRVDVLQDGLVATYYQEQGATALVRGVRNSTDYEYENGVSKVNRKQYQDLDTIILFASEEYSYLSSSLIKEIAYFHGDISQMVPPHIARAMEAKYQAIQD